MGAIDKARQHLADRLEPGEEVIDAVQVMTPGSMKSFATAGVAGILGLVGSMALQSLGGRRVPMSDDLDEAKRIDLRSVSLGQFAFSNRRVFLVPASTKKAEIIELPLAGTSVGWEEKGKVSLRVRHYLVSAADGRWFLAEVQAGLWKKSNAAEFTDRLAAAIRAAD